MKLRSGKILGEIIKKSEEQINLSPEIKLEITKTLDSLKILLKDNPEFFSVLIEKSLLLGKEIYRDGIIDLIWDEYPTLNEDQDGDGLQLWDDAYDLGQLISGNHDVIKNEIRKNPQEKWEEYRIMLREVVEKEIDNISHSIYNDEVVSMTGTSEHSFNDLDI